MAEQNVSIPNVPLNLRIQQLERLLEVSRTLSSLLELEPLLQMIIDAASDLTYSQESSILLYDDLEGDLKFEAAPWFKSSQMQELRVPIEGSIAGEVFTYGEPVVVRDAVADGRIFRAVDEHTGFETHSLLSVPLKVEEVCFGVLTAVNKYGGHFTSEDQYILETLASQAAVAIQNAKSLIEIQKAYEELADLDQMKTDFIAITSHELRTPLGLILGHATFLQDALEDDQREQMAVIIESALRLKEIIEDLSKVDNYRTGAAVLNWETVDLGVLVRRVSAGLMRLAEDYRVRIEFQLPGRPLVIRADGEKLGLALSHIIRNGIMYNNPGGQVTVSIEKADGFAQFRVVDDGIGIPEGEQEKVFERFYQVENHMVRRRGGMGLGLSVAQLMVEMHQGRISLESEPGVGSTFTVLIPLDGEQDLSE
ncbi:MAG TPA: hypothetical protein DCY42_12185 [Chloroflexi bacterium]|nr:hypothetical protein [Chloroflexota bacterium]